MACAERNNATVIVHKVWSSHGSDAREQATMANQHFFDTLVSNKHHERARGASEQQLYCAIQRTTSC